MGEERKLYKVMVGKPEGKRALGKPRRRREKGIRMYLIVREIGWRVQSVCIWLRIEAGGELL
jgi:hypothetical protein